MSRLETNGYYALGVPLYFAVMGVEMLLARRKGRRIYRFADTLGNFSAGLGEVIIGIFLGPLLLFLYDFGYEHIALYRFPEGSIAHWIVAFLLADLCYYAYHRAGHTVGAFWAIHGVHHQSEEFNVSLALRHPWLSDSYSALFYIPLPLLGVGATQFFVAITIISFYALTVHSHMFQRPSLYLFVTPATHIVHHAKNPRYLNKNYGAMFTLWDRMFGTYVEVTPDDPVELGTTFGYETHDGAKAQWVFVRNVLFASKHARTLSEKASAFFGFPGWTPPGVRLPKAAPPRDDAAIPTLTKVYAASQFGLILVFALQLLWLRDAHSFGVLLASSLLVLVSLSTIGGLLDGRESAVRNELLRLASAALLAAALLRIEGESLVGAGLLLAAAASAIGVVAARRSLDTSRAASASGVTS